MNKTYVIALGGNSILRANEKGTTEEQYSNLRMLSEELLEILASDNRVVITHGNGPQVGNFLLAMEAAKDIIPPIPLDICGAATEGSMGFMIQNTLANHLRDAKIPHNITTVVTQVIVDAGDPAFNSPSKPIGPFYCREEAEQLKAEKKWVMIEDSARGYRRVVPSPRPVQIQQARIIKSMLEAGEIVIAVGGGGIPVIRKPDRSLYGIEAVIDKDYASSRLAVEIGADVLLILTAVEKVYRDFNKPTQQALDCIDCAEAEQMLEEGQFGKGSMEPKIRAAIEFLTSDTSGSQEREVFITLPERAIDAIKKKTGTRIVR